MAASLLGLLTRESELVTELNGYNERIENLKNEISELEKSKSNVVGCLISLRSVIANYIDDKFVKTPGNAPYIK